MKTILFSLALVSAFPAWCSAATEITVKATNKLPLARASQTIELSAQDLAPLGETNLQRIHVRDSAGKEVLCQAVDTNFDEYHTPDIVIFQADFATGESKTFTASAGRKVVYTKADFKAYGRFVRERFDDFAWENDRIAHRTYGKALETWKGEPLTSSSIDVWSKRVPYMVIDGWYMVDNYHEDTGEGCDDYSAGDTRGCGGTGLWADNRLWVSGNFVNSRLLAAGPIRVMFELDYEPFDVAGKKVAETKRVSLDAGSQLDHYQSFFKAQEAGTTLAPAAGLKRVGREQKTFNAEHGWLGIWEPMEKGMGMLGVALVVDPKSIVRQEQERKDNLVLIKPAADNSISYWSGFAWDGAGHITTAEAWQKYLDEFAQGMESPIEVRVTAN